MHLRHADLAVTPWRNGAGRKADVVGGPGWLVTFAWVDRDAEFSDFAGQDRTITLIEGEGFTLDFQGQPPLVLDRLLEPRWFDGGWRARCRLHGSPSMVLNAISERVAWRHSVEIRAPRPDDTGFAVLLEEAGAGYRRLDTITLPAPVTIRCAVIRFERKA
ncbi:MAG: hypothetical protein AVDCRST_MAG27-4649 [uncultured Craurococcus sp.]|uniref:HutD family protein n=1 Tax=uncultured Craurococcus sp. TaxID=1135998 RepID=A0A6J4JU93_9PROT|nr:MAG: hypothetical protein AVDCRST_MAG27-4649 [uncultured Craurococcus sp.]